MYGAAFFRQPPYAMYMIQERFRNEGGKYFDADTMKATINSDVGVKVFTDAQRKQVHAAGRRAIWLRREPRRVPARPDGDDHLMAALWSLGRRLRHRPGSAKLGSEVDYRRQGRLRLIARRASRAGSGFRALGRLQEQEQGCGLPVHPVAEQRGHQPSAGEASLCVARSV